MAWIDALFQRMAQQGASDLHMTSNLPPMLRQDGDIQPVEDVPPIAPDQMSRILAEITPQQNQQQFDDENDTDFAYELPGVGRFRANLFRDNQGPGAVFRLIPSDILTAEQLGLPPAIIEMCNLSKGLVVVTGPTGSGKSTTLAAMIDHINKSRSDHILTIEDPIEFVHPQHRCLVNQREVGSHTGGFKRALRAALREDPDIVLVGEMRDLETIEIAIETAETGHLVFGTLHTTTAASTVDRIIDQFPADRQSQIRTMLSSSLKGVVAQTLCKKKPKGRVAALEVLVVNSAVSSQIREGKTHQIINSMQMGGKLGMQMLNDALAGHVKQGTVDPQEAYLKAVDKDGFLNTLSGLGVSWTPGKAKAAPPAAALPTSAPAAAAPSAQLDLAGSLPNDPPAAAEPQAPMPSNPAPSNPAPEPQAGSEAQPGDAPYADPFDAFKKKRR